MFFEDSATISNAIAKGESDGQATRLDLPPTILRKSSASSVASCRVAGFTDTHILRILFRLHGARR
jgi:hypothetical protein